jgi:hypothetical protein
MMMCNVVSPIVWWQRNKDCIKGECFGKGEMGEWAEPEKNEIRRRGHTHSEGCLVERCIASIVYFSVRISVTPGRPLPINYC